MSSNLSEAELDANIKRMVAEQQPYIDIPAENREIVEDLLDNKEINSAALKFKNGVVKLKKMVDYLPQKSVARVFKAVIEFPLGDKYPKFRTNTHEQELFNLTLELIAAKNLMIEAVVEEQKRLASKLETPPEVKSEVV